MIWKVTFVLSLVVAVMVGYWLGERKAHRDFLRPVEIVRSKRTRMAKAPKKAIVEARARRNVIEESQDQHEQAHPSLEKLCLTDWQRMAGMTQTQLEESLLTREAVLGEACAQAMLKEVSLNEVIQYLRQCRDQREELSLSEIEAVCWPLGNFVQGYARRRLTETGDGLALSAQELSEQLLVGLANLKDSSKQALEMNIKLADQLIERDPSNYVAYKGKLLSLLVSEVKHGAEIDPSVYEDLYGQMLQFEIRDGRDELLQALQLNEEELTNEPLELSGLDRDLLHIPFLRYSALNDVEALWEISQEYADEYPESYIGNLYLAEAYWKQGDSNAAIEALKSGKGENVDDTIILQIFRQLQADPLERLNKMAEQELSY